MDFANRIAASSVTFRDEPLADALHRLHELGFTRFDLTAIRHYCDHFDPLLVSVGEAECVRVQDVIAHFGMQTVSITSYPANPLAKDLNGDDWASGVDAYVRLALFLLPNHLIFPPGGPAPAEDRWRGTVEHAKPWLREAAERTQRAHVQPTIALQSNSLLRTAQQGAEFLRILGVPGVGLAVDPAHLAAMGEDPAAAIRQLGDLVAYVVLRDTDGTDYNLPPGRGELPYPRILDALDEIGYGGPYVLAIDDVSLAAAQRAELLARGREYLERYAQRKAA